jgi:hypothetical protein
MKVIAIYPGRFHPFHKGHAASFKQLADSFGIQHTYLALSEKQEQPKSPFSAGDRAKMAMALGIPKENIISVRNTYGGDEYIQRFQAAGINPEQTALVFGVSGKDMGADPRFSFAPKKDGNPSYLQPYGSQLQPMTKHAYVVTTNVASFPIAGQDMTDASQIRSAYIKGNQKMKQQILVDLYGNTAKLIKPVFDASLNLTESLKQRILALKERMQEKTKVKVCKYCNRPEPKCLCSQRESIETESIEKGVDLTKSHPMDYGKRRLMIRDLSRVTGWEISDIELASDEELQQLYDEHVRPKLSESFPKQDYLSEK